VFNFLKGLAAFALFGAMFLVFVTGVGLIVWLYIEGRYGWAALVGVALAVWGYLSQRSAPGEPRNDFGV